MTAGKEPRDDATAAMLAVFSAQFRPPRVHVSKSAAFERFQATYRNDQPAFVRDCFRWRDIDSKPTAYQEQIGAALSSSPIARVTVRAPHGAGKTAIAAQSILWFALTRSGERWKSPTTAGSHTQLQKYLWPEVHLWAGLLDWARIGREEFQRPRELQLTTLRTGGGEGFAASPRSAALIEGAHAPHMFYVYDEAKAIASGLFDATEGGFSAAGPGTKNEALALAISTPGPPSGRFFEFHHEPTRRRKHPEWEAIHVTVEQCIAAGRLTRHWAELMRQKWGDTDPRYLNRVLAEFAESDEQAVIALADLERAFDLFDDLELYTDRPAVDSSGRPYYPPELGTLLALAVDVAAGGSARTKIARRYERPDGLQVIPRLEDHTRKRRGDSLETASHIVGILEGTGAKVVADVLGVGEGVYSGLVAAGVPIVPFVAGAATTARDESGEVGFLNVRAAGWWNVRQILKGQGGVRLAIARDDDLEDELLAPRWREAAGGRIQIESKDDLEKADRLGRSPDSADAVVQVCYDVPPEKRDKEAIPGDFAEWFTGADVAEIGPDRRRRVLDDLPRIGLDDLA